MLKTMMRRDIEGFAHLFSPTRPPLHTLHSKLHHLKLLPATGLQHVTFVEAEMCKFLDIVGLWIKFNQNISKGRFCHFATFFRLGEARRAPR